HLPPCRCLINAPPPTQPYTLSLHDALPICTGSHPDTRGAKCSGRTRGSESQARPAPAGAARSPGRPDAEDPSACTCRCRPSGTRSEEHTSELQSRENLVCRLLLEKKKTR